MSKYQKGDKFVIEIEETDEHNNYRILGYIWASTDELDKLERLDSDYINEHYGELQDEAYNKGLEDAWRVFAHVQSGELSIEEINSVWDMNEVTFANSFTERYTPQEALSKLEAYEKEQAEIKVGDVVQFEGKIGVVTAITEGKEVKTADILRKDGQFTISWCIAKCKKTGKHIDIQGVLRQIGGDVNGNS